MAAGGRGSSGGRRSQKVRSALPLALQEAISQPYLSSIRSWKTPVAPVEEARGWGGRSGKSHEDASVLLRSYASAQSLTEIR